MRDHRVGNGPNQILKLGLIEQLEKVGVRVHIDEIQPVDEFEEEIDRSFEVQRRTSVAVSKARANRSFPFILSGNCMATVGAACGLGIKDLNFVYFDAHDDMDTPSTNENGYFDAMDLSMLADKSWHWHTQQIPGYSPMSYKDRFLYVGLRDVTDIQKKAVAEAGVDVIWGGAEKPVGFARELEMRLGQRDFAPSLVHLDLGVSDHSIGKVNGYESAGGLHEADLMQCMTLVSKKATGASFTICSFDPDLGSGNKIAAIRIQVAVTFVESLIMTSVPGKAE